MEIPFIVNARKDTGLFNAKVGIWLFLASEVTLFGGLFSGYLFLRLYADYPWPERALPVLPGLINTFVLIGSSVTVVFAWAALKMREWRKFQVYMAITLLCAAIFMVLKGIEYKAKFGHQAVKIAGGGPVQGHEIVEGHVHKGVLIGEKLVEDKKETIDHTVEELSKKRYAEFTDKKKGTLVPWLTKLKELRKVHQTLESGIAANDLKIEGIESEIAKLEEADEEAAEAASKEIETKRAAISEINSETDKLEDTKKENEREIVLLKRQGGKSNFLALIDGKTEDLDAGEPAAVAASLTEEELTAAIAADLREYKIETGYANKILMKTDELTFVLTRPTHEAYLEAILEQAGDNHSITLTKSYKVIDRDELFASKSVDRKKLLESANALVAKEGAELSVDLIDELEDAYLEARSHDRKIRTKFLAASWEWIRNVKGDEDISTKVVEKQVWKDRREDDETKLKLLTLRAASEVTFTIDPPLTLVLDPGDLVKKTKPGDLNFKLRDDTLVSGEVLPCPILMGVDALDFRTTAQRAKAEDLDPLPVIEGTWLLTHKDPHHSDHKAKEGEEETDDRNEFKKIWDCHMAWLETEEERLKKMDRVPTDNDRYRVNWDQVLAYRGLDYDVEKVREAIKAESLERTGLFDLDGFAGANHKIYEFPHLEIPRANVGFDSTFTPKWNTYYAIYFTITGLHGLHVIGGALVLGYYLFFGRKMYESNPEWLANRVEVGGLFWHFVDLVWIFLFPILYLM